MNQPKLWPSGTAAPGNTLRLLRVARSMAWLMWVMTLVQVVMGVCLAVLNHLSLTRSFAEYVVSQSAAALAFATVGLLITHRRPVHTIGWLLCVTGVIHGISSWVGQYARYSLVTQPGALPLGELAAAVNIWVFGPIVALTAIFLPLLFPDGHLPSPRWRPVGWIAIAATILFTAVHILGPGPVDASLPEVANPFAPTGIEHLLRVLNPLAIMLMLLSLASAATAPILRYRRTQQMQRLQIKWFAYATSLLIVALVTPPLLDPTGFTDPVNGNTFLSGLLLAGAFPLVASAVGIAILRYRLYDIDLLISRTLVYSALTACVIGVYVFVVGYLGALFQADGNLAISLVATGIVAVLFQPLRAWLQYGVNRLLYGERDEPYAVITRLGQRLEATLASDAVLPTIVETVAHALKLPYVAIALSYTEGEHVVAACGNSQLVSLRLPLMYQGDTVGHLLVAARTPGELFTPADETLLDVLADQVAVAAHAVRLTNELQRLTAALQHSREQLVTTREEERRRLRRDLHDGVGPTLASLAQRLDVARNLVEPDPVAADTLLIDIKGQVKGTIADIRRLVYALRPPVLDELGLISAIREHITQMNQSSNLHITFDAPDHLPPLPAAVEVAAYRISLEAVTNVLRHAQARTCRVSLCILEDNRRRTLCVEIVDDGVGVSPEPRSGVGLTSMRERATELGGTWNIARVSPAGTQVLAMLPLSL